jgi:hypothetical protein
MDAARPATTLKRRRPAKSCEPCRLRKIRCDLTQPCGACRRSRGPTNCTYRSADGCATASGTGSPSSAKKSRLRAAAAEPQADREAGSAQEHRTLPVRHANENPEDSLRVLPATHRDAYKGTAIPPVAALAPAGLAYQPNLRLRNARDKTRLFGPSHWMYTAEILVRQ